MAVNSSLAGLRGVTDDGFQSVRRAESKDGSRTEGFLPAILLPPLDFISNALPGMNSVYHDEATFPRAVSVIVRSPQYVQSLTPNRAD